MKCTQVDLETGTCWFTHTETGVQQEVKADYVIGGDGAFSPVRDKMQRTNRFDYSQ